MKTRKLKNSLGQSAAEYGILIVMIAATFTAVAHFLQYGIFAGVQRAADEIGSQVDAYETAREDSSWEKGDSHETTGPSNDRQQTFKTGIYRSDFNYKWTSSSNTDTVTYQDP